MTAQKGKYPWVVTTVFSIDQKWDHPKQQVVVRVEDSSTPPNLPPNLLQAPVLVDQENFSHQRSPSKVQIIAPTHVPSNPQAVPSVPLPDQQVGVLADLRTAADPMEEMYDHNQEAMYDLLEMSVPRQVLLPTYVHSNEVSAQVDLRTVLSQLLLELPKMIVLQQMSDLPPAFLLLANHLVNPIDSADPEWEERMRVEMTFLYAALLGEMMTIVTLEEILEADQLHSEKATDFLVETEETDFQEMILEVMGVEIIVFAQIVLCDQLEIAVFLEVMIREILEITVMTEIEVTVMTGIEITAMTEIEITVMTEEETVNNQEKVGLRTVADLTAIDLICFTTK